MIGLFSRVLGGHYENQPCREVEREHTARAYQNAHDERHNPAPSRLPSAMDAERTTRDARGKDGHCLNDVRPATNKLCYAEHIKPKRRPEAE